MVQIIVSIKRGVPPEVFAEALLGAGLVFQQIEGLPRHFLVECVAADDFPLKDHPAVEAVADGDAPVRPSLPQDITLDANLLNGSWALPRIIRRSAPWNVDRLRHPVSTYFTCARDGAGVDYYSLDTGVYTSHAEFGGRVTNVYEFYSSGGAGDDNGHGTGTTSCAIGATVGIARGSLGFSFKMGDSSGNSTNTALASAIGQLLTHYSGRSGTNRPAVCSISYAFADTAVLSAIADLIDAGIVVVGSAGNGMVDLSTINVFPAEAPDAICAGGLGMADLPYFASADGTNFGTAVDILGPAQAVRYAAAPVQGIGDYRTHRGTSLAAPFVAGVVACMLQGHNRLTSRTQVQAVKTKLLANATTGKLRSAFGLSPLPDRLLYLDPNQAAPEPISGL